MPKTELQPPASAARVEARYSRATLGLTIMPPSPAHCGTAGAPPRPRLRMPSRRYCAPSRIATRRPRPAPRRHSEHVFDLRARTSSPPLRLCPRRRRCCAGAVHWGLDLVLSASLKATLSGYAGAGGRWGAVAARRHNLLFRHHGRQHRDPRHLRIQPLAIVTFKTLNLPPGWRGRWTLPAVDWDRRRIASRASPWLVVLDAPSIFARR